MGAVGIMETLSPTDLEDIKEKKSALLKEFLALEPPNQKGDDLIELWDKLYCKDMKSAVVDTKSGDSNDAENWVFPYQKIRAVVGDGGNWKWPRMWQRLDEIDRRGSAFRAGEVINFQPKNKNEEIVPQKCLVVGGG